MVVALVEGKFYQTDGQRIETPPPRAAVVVLWASSSAGVSELVGKRQLLDLKVLLDEFDLRDKQLFGFECSDGMFAITNIKDTFLGKFVDQGRFKQLTDTFGQPYLLDAAFFRRAETRVPKRGVAGRVFGAAAWDTRRFLVVSGALFALSVVSVGLGWGLEYASKRFAATREGEAKAFYRSVEANIRRKAGGAIAEANPKIYRRVLNVAANLAEHEIVSATFAKDKGLIVVLVAEGDSPSTERLARFGRVVRDGKHYQISIP